jgi:hypothetical protein
MHMLRIFTQMQIQNLHMHKQKKFVFAEKIKIYFKNIKAKSYF